MTHTIFDRKRVRQHRDRAAHAFSAHDFLLRDIAERLCDRLSDMSRTFPMALDLGAHTGIVAETLQGRGGIETLVQADLSPTMLVQAQGLRVNADEEFLPFAQDSFDLVLNAGSLHWVNDLPGALIQINRVLKPDGLFLATMPGGETLKELRQAFERAELDMYGGLSPRISPFVDVRDAGSLLQRAGFTMPVVDSDTLSVLYQDPFTLLRDLRGMGEANALLEGRKRFTARSVLLAMLEQYRSACANAAGQFPASFELVTLTAWKATIK